MPVCISDTTAHLILQAIGNLYIEDPSAAFADKMVVRMLDRLVYIAAAAERKPVDLSLIDKDVEISVDISEAEVWIFGS